MWPIVGLIRFDPWGRSYAAVAETGEALLLCVRARLIAVLGFGRRYSA